MPPKNERYQQHTTAAIRESHTVHEESPSLRIIHSRGAPRRQFTRIFKDLSQDKSDAIPFAKSEFMYLVDAVLFPVERAGATIDCDPQCGRGNQRRRIINLPCGHANSIRQSSVGAYSNNSVIYKRQLAYLLPRALRWHQWPGCLIPDLNGKVSQTYNKCVKRNTYQSL